MSTERSESGDVGEVESLMGFPWRAALALYNSWH